MTVTQPNARIQYVENEVHDAHNKVEDWKQEHDRLTNDCWAWEEIIAKANYLFGRILDLDSDVQSALFRGLMKYDPDLDARIDKLVHDWRSLARDILPQADRLEGEYGTVEGADELRTNVQEAEGILTPDGVFFAGDALARRCDEAVRAHRAGETEALLDDEHVR